VHTERGDARTVAVALPGEARCPPCVVGRPGAAACQRVIEVDVATRAGRSAPGRIRLGWGGARLRMPLVACGPSMAVF